MARIQSDVFQLAVETAECWKCHKQARVCAPIAPIGSVAIDDECDPIESLVVNEATVLMDVESMSADLGAAARRAVPTFRPDFSKTTGAGYWMNHCQHCGAKMGDFFLHMEPDGPFFAWPQESSATGTVLDLVGGEIVCGTMPYIETPPLRRKHAKRKP